MPVTQLTEAPREFRNLLFRSDRVTERDLTAPFNAIHDESGPLLIKQQLFVAE